MGKLISVAFLALLLAGCGTPSGGSNSSASAKVHTELAGLYYERVQYGIALDEIAQALQADPDYAPAYGVRGLIHMALREDNDAEEDFRKGLRLDKLDSNIQNNYGWFLCQHGREKESIPHFLAALKNPLYGTPGVAYLNAGMCSRKAGDNKDAEEFFQKALLVQPGMPQALMGLAELSFSEGEYASAKQYFAKLSDRNDNLTAEQLWLGIRIQRKAGDRNSESSFSVQLRKRFPDAKETQMLMRGE